MKLPIRAGHELGGGEENIYDADGEFIADCFDAKCASEIVRAFICVEELRAENQRLRAVIQLAHKELHSWCGNDSGSQPVLDKLAVALAGEDGPEFLKEPGGSPITEEWLQSTGIYVAHGSPKVFRCSLPENRWGLGLIDIQRDATRSAVLALLAALGVR